MIPATSASVAAASGCEPVTTTTTSSGDAKLSSSSVVGYTREEMIAIRDKGDGIVRPAYLSAEYNDDTEKFAPEKWFDHQFSNDSQKSRSGKKKALGRTEEEQIGLSPQRRVFASGCAPGQQQQRGEGKGWRTAAKTAGNKEKTDSKGKTDRCQRKNQQHTEQLPEWVENPVNSNDVMDLIGFDDAPSRKARRGRVRGKKKSESIANGDLLTDASAPPATGGSEIVTGISEMELIDIVLKKPDAVEEDSASALAGSRFLNFFKQKSAAERAALGKPPIESSTVPPANSGTVMNAIFNNSTNWPDMPTNGGITADQIEARMFSSSTSPQPLPSAPQQAEPQAGVQPTSWAGDGHLRTQSPTKSGWDGISNSSGLPPHFLSGLMNLNKTDQQDQLRGSYDPAAGSRPPNLTLPNAFPPGMPLPGPYGRMPYPMPFPYGIPPGMPPFGPSGPSSTANLPTSVLLRMNVPMSQMNAPGHMPSSSPSSMISGDDKNTSESIRPPPGISSPRFPPPPPPFELLNMMGAATGNRLPFMPTNFPMMPGVYPQMFPPAGFMPPGYPQQRQHLQRGHSPSSPPIPILTDHRFHQQHNPSNPLSHPPSMLPSTHRSAIPESILQALPRGARPMTVNDLERQIPTSILQALPSDARPMTVGDLERQFVNSKPAA